MLLKLWQKIEEINFLVKGKDCIPLRHQTDKLKIERKYESNNRT